MDLTNRLQATEDKLAIHEGRSKIATHAGDSSPEERLKNLELKLNQSNYEIESLKEALKLEKERVETFQGISQASEERLSELNNTYDLFKAETERELSEAKAQAAVLEKERDEIRERLNNTVQEVTATQEKMDAKQVEFDKRVHELEAHLEGAKRTEASALAQHEEMKKDVELHSKIAKEAQQNYEREVIAHSSSLQALTKSKEELINLRNQLAETEVCSGHEWY